MKGRALTFIGMAAVGLVVVVAAVIAMVLGTELLDPSEEGAAPIVAQPAVPAGGAVKEDVVIQGHDPSLQGCILYPNGATSRQCSLSFNCPSGQSVCILDDGTVCVGLCDPCTARIDGKWVPVNGWQNPEGDPIVIAPPKAVAP